jgi:hypothetical protein
MEVRDMGHEVLRGILTKSTTWIYAGSQNEDGEYREEVEEWEIGDRGVAGWLRQFSLLTRTLAIISGVHHTQVHSYPHTHTHTLVVYMRLKAIYLYPYS